MDSLMDYCNKINNYCLWLTKLSLNALKLIQLKIFFHKNFITEWIFCSKIAFEEILFKTLLKIELIYNKYFFCFYCTYSWNWGSPRVEPRGWPHFFWGKGIWISPHIFSNWNFNQIFNEFDQWFSNFTAFTSFVLYFGRKGCISTLVTPVIEL